MSALAVAAAVGLAGAAGSLARVWLDAVLDARRTHDPGRRATPWPWGTLWANAAGSLLLGAVAAGAGPVAAAVVGAGLCGGLTTFSTFSVAAVRLWADGRRGVSVGYVVATLLLGIGAAGAGWAAGGVLAGG